MDLNGDGVVSLEEFLQVCLEDESISRSITAFANVSIWNLPLQEQQAQVPELVAAKFLEPWTVSSEAETKENIFEENWLVQSESTND